MSDQLAEWQTRLNTVGPISYPEQQELVALALGFRAEADHLREGLNAAGDMLARVMEADDGVVDAEIHEMVAHPMSVNAAGVLHTCTGDCGWGWRTLSLDDAQERWNEKHA